MQKLYCDSCNALLGSDGAPLKVKAKAGPLEGRGEIHLCPRHAAALVAMITGKAASPAPEAPAPVGDGKPRRGRKGTPTP